MGLFGSWTWGAAASSGLLEMSVVLASAFFMVYPLTQRQAELPPVGAEPGAVVTSLHGGCQKNFLSWVSCSRCSHLGIWCINSLCPRIWESRILCLGVACGRLKVGFFGRFCGYSWAMLGSTVDTCSASVLGAFGRNLHFSVNFPSFQHVAECTLHRRCTLTSFLPCLLFFFRLSTDRYSSVVQYTV